MDLIANMSVGFAVALQPNNLLYCFTDVAAPVGVRRASVRSRRLRCCP